MIDILEESRVFSTRHLTYEEKQAVIECLIDSIRKGKVKIADRVENHEFMEKFKLNDHDVLEYLGKYLKPGDIRATLLSRKNHNEELYLCNPRVPNSNLFLYVKFAINPDSSIDIISFHESSEPIYVSFEKASDFQDNSFEERALRKTIYNYRRFSKVNKNEIVDFFLQGNVAKITFRSDVDEPTKSGIIKSLPADMGLDRRRMIKELKEFGTQIDLPFFTKNF